MTDRRAHTTERITTLHSRMVNICNNHSWAVMSKADDHENDALLLNNRHADNRNGEGKSW